jgi:TRAP transporter TAXI family solute receptor
MKCKYCKIWLPTLAIVLLGLLITYQFTEPPPPGEISIATGRKGGAYHNFALEYQKRLAEQQMKLKIQPTAGSIEILKSLKAGTVSVGIVQGGTGHKVSPEGLESLASLFYEPLWVFYRREQPFEYLFDLRGKRVAVGEVGSGTRPLALKLLQDNQVTQDNTNFFNVSSKIATEKLVAGEIDVAFFVMSPTSDLIFELLNNPNIELLSFKRHLAYSSRYPFLTSVEIGEGMVNLENNIPRQNKILLAATATLVAREGLHPDIIHLLLKAMAIHEKMGLIEKKGQFPSEQFVEFPINEEASHYLLHGQNWLQKLFPFRIASTLDRLKIMLIPLLAVIISLFRNAIPLYRWGIRFKIFRWYAILHKVDSKVNQLTDLAAIEEQIKHLKLLQTELVEQVSVPLSYMGEFYGLRIHVNLVLAKLNEHRQELLVQSS